MWHAQDPAAKKPEDWDDRAMIDDPEDKKVRSPRWPSKPACLPPPEGSPSVRLLYLAPRVSDALQLLLSQQSGSFRDSQGMLHAFSVCHQIVAYEKGADQGA